MKQKLFILVIALFGLYGQLMAQTTITGNVKDATGEPIIGASIIVTGTSNGTVTDFDGNFEMKANEGDELTVSYVGFATQTVKVSGSAPIDITLLEDNALLEEVVVVGYGTQKKANLTGSVSSVDSKDLGNRAITSVAMGLEGKMAGVQIKNNTGRPGVDDSDNAIRIRGTGTFNNAAPMIIVDGMESTMYNLDPNDIESISVLKDAASAAIYGSKAANGVIVVTTKRGKAGKAVVNYSATFGWSKPTRLAKYVNSAEYAELTNEARANEGYDPLYTQQDIELFRNGSDPYGHPNTDWYDLMYQGSGFQMTHNLNMSGGNEDVRYMASVGYTDQNGIIKNFGNDKYNIRLNLDANITKRLEASFSLAYTREDVVKPTGPDDKNFDYFFYLLTKLSPMVPCYLENGDYGYIGDGNPIAWLNGNSTADQIRNNIQLVGSLKYNILPELSFKVMTSYKAYSGETHEMHKAVRYNVNYTHGSVDKLTEGLYSDFRISNDFLLEYTKTFNDAHHLHALAGYHTEYFRDHFIDAYRENLANSELYELNAAGTKNQSSRGGRHELSMISYFGRVNYDYLGRYLFEANLRYDGTSRFARGHRWGAFPSVSAGWRFSDEKFWESLVNVIDNAKLRASWGQLGNQDIIGYYPTVSTLTLGQNYPFGGVINSGAVTTQAVNPKLKWESTTTWGIGLDLTFFNRLNVILDYYNKTTNGILMPVNTPVTYALSDYYDNVGKVRNSGFELSLDYHGRIGKVNYTVGGNFSYNKNEILDMGEGGDQLIQDTNGAVYAIMRKGEAMNSFYGYKTDGYFQSEAEIQQAYPNGWTQFGGRDPQPGDIKYVDINGDGKLDANDRTTLGSWSPSVTFGFNLGADWNGFDFTAAFQGAAGVKGYITREGVGYVNGDASKPSTLWLDHWTPQNTNAATPRLIQGMEGWSMPTTTSDFWIQNASYLRMKTLQIGYTFPKTWLNKIGITNVRLFYTGENLLTFTGFMDGYDPEAPITNDNMKGNYYPQIKTHSFGLNVTF
ncbi:MAG: TonB-dependent receptor [Prevotella sp.]|jgi:TonB-linked SusC/RagA family outer membrane protein|nr:TonB-dependent receptor [Prevotella sp.]MBO5627209.1 TonB-dependent receptor [Prevotella sp.]